MFSSTMHHGNGGVGPLTVKHAEAHFHHNHPQPSTIGQGKKIMSGEQQARAGSSGIPEHLMLNQHNTHLAGGAQKLIMVINV